MDKNTFNYYWKIGVLVTFIIVAIFLIIQFKDFNSKGVVCQKQPFIYGAKIMANQYEDGHIFCTCSITGVGVQKSYAFNEIKENPQSKYNLSELMGVK